MDIAAAKEVLLDEGTVSKFAAIGTYHEMSPVGFRFHVESVPMHRILGQDLFFTKRCKNFATKCQSLNLQNSFDNNLCAFLKSHKTQHELIS